jgi:C-terminal processing protease CtpA/Prc
MVPRMAGASAERNRLGVARDWIMTLNTFLSFATTAFEVESHSDATEGSAAALSSIQVGRPGMLWQRKMKNTNWKMFRQALVPHLFILGVSLDAADAKTSRSELFEEVWKIVRDEFFDSHLRGVDWDGVRQRFSPQVDGTGTSEEFASVVNKMLLELHTSHTQYYTPDDPAYFQLAGIFWRGLEPKVKRFLANGKPDYPGIGVFTRMIDGKSFIEAILDGSPAAGSGLKVGDEILNVEGERFRPVASFEGKANQPVTIEVRRTSNGTRTDVSVTPKLLDPTTMFIDAMKQSVKVIEEKGVKIGYVHIWSYAGPTISKSWRKRSITGSEMQTPW